MQQFIPIAHVCNGGEAWGVCFDGKTTVLLANGSDGLRAYEYDGKTLTNTAHVHDAGHALKVVIDGKNRVYLANIYDGLRVYDYSGHDFEIVAWYGKTSSTNVRDVALGAESIIHFVDGQSLVALQVVKYSHLPKYTDKEKESDAKNNRLIHGTCAIQESQPQGVTLDSSGLLFIAVGGIGSDGGMEVHSHDSITRSYPLRCLVHDGSDARGIAVSPNGTVFLSCFTQGLKVYDWNGETNQLTFKTAINDGGEALRVKVAPDGTILLANGSDGLRAYSYDGTTLSNVAHVNDGGRVCDVAVSAEGTVFLASETEGLFAYETK